MLMPETHVTRRHTPTTAKHIPADVECNAKNPGGLGERVALLVRATLRGILARKCRGSFFHGATESAESGPNAADGDVWAKRHVLQTPFEYEYEYRCAEYEYEKLRQSAIALLSLLLRALRASVSP
jgi:hypothetical protein